MLTDQDGSEPIPIINTRRMIHRRRHLRQREQEEYHHRHRSIVVNHNTNPHLLGSQDRMILMSIRPSFRLQRQRRHALYSCNETETEDVVVS